MGAPSPLRGEFQLGREDLGGGGLRGGGGVGGGGGGALVSV